MTDGEKEQIKLRAAYINGVALILFGVSAFGPFFSGLASLEIKKAIFGIIWFWAGGMSSWELHSLAQRHLKRLDKISTHNEHE